MAKTVVTFEVPLGARSYPIFLGRDLSGPIGEALTPYLAPSLNLGCVADEGVRSVGLWPETLPSETLIPLHGRGETLKAFPALEQILETLAQRRVDRAGAVVALGGGVVGDLAGFAAASYLRGVAFFQIPTTLLAMVDSSVGGKTGINLKAGKNLAGAFWQPKAVFIDLDMLATLPPREFAAGMAEVIKYGLLDDAEFYRELQALGTLNAGSEALTEVVRRCCAIKAQIVADDERETAAGGGRARLNLGHTFAHAIEAVAGYGDYLHGEAVAIGLVLAAKLSARLGGAVDAAEIDALVALFQRYNLPTDIKGEAARPLAVADLIDVMTRDKKTRGGKLRFVVMPAIGQTEVRGGIDTALIEELWREAGAV
ncbi:MAG: 3-dehydroquinate synthase [Opitutales bacterium]